MLVNFERVIACLNRGGIIAYPTEAVYGLGCNPFNETAVHKIVQLKKRSLAKGLILITHDWQCVADLIMPIPEERMVEIQKTWPGPYTWIFPASKKVPLWIKGQHNSIALRVTAHPIAREICSSYGLPIVSTSANTAFESPFKTAQEVSQHFGEQIDMIVPGEVGNLLQPTTIRDAVSGQIIR